jgi:ABC-type multidrug transport system ATPase subunit
MIEADHLAYRYGRRRWGLVDATFAVDSPAVGVLGPNGAGKSTLLSLLTAARTPSSGRLVVNGLDVQESRQRTRLRAMLGFVPQSLNVYPHYTVEEFLAYVAWLRRVPPSEVEPNMRQSLVATDLTQLRTRKIRTLSGGMRQRVVLAQALVNNPALVVLDEPTVGLDPEQRAHFIDKITQLKEQTRVVLATHLVEDVAAVCDQVVVLMEGRVAFHGTAQDLVRVADDGADVRADSIQAAYLQTLQRARAAESPGHDQL